MRTLALLLVLGVTAAAVGQASAPTDELVAAAKAAKEKKKKSTTRVITNADVKKAKAKVAENKAVTPVEPAPRSLAEQYEKSYHERLVNDEKVAAAKRKVAELERDLAAAEQSYYEENDLDRRDTEIVKRFNDTKAKLEQARKELAALEPPSPSS
jgi:membrane-bound lytic murein transglycosylase B